MIRIILHQDNQFDHFAGSGRTAENNFLMAKVRLRRSDNKVVKLLRPLELDRNRSVTFGEKGRAGFPPPSARFADSLVEIETPRGCS